MVSGRMNVFAVVWKRGFLYKAKHISKFPVNAAKFISNISPPSMVRVILSLESRIVTWIGFLFFGLAFSLKRKGKKKENSEKKTNAMENFLAKMPTCHFLCEFYYLWP